LILIATFLKPSDENFRPNLQELADAHVRQRKHYLARLAVRDAELLTHLADAP
jgi:hypothetical protein